jgi:hypothetical protein
LFLATISQGRELIKPAPAMVAPVVCRNLRLEYMMLQGLFNL